MRERARLIAFSLLVWFGLAMPARTAQEPQLSEEQMRQFLLTAKVIRSRGGQKGITDTSRLTLSDGNIIHDASFQSIDDHRQKFEGTDGTIEMNFVDSFKYNIAAYELAKMLGIGDMMPVTVRRKCMGKDGSLSWWLPVKIDELERIRRKIPIPDTQAYNRFMHKQRVFAELVYDTDRNRTNVVFSPEWQMWMIDFSRSFRLHRELKEPKILERCDRQLLENLRKLNEGELTAQTKDLLNKAEIQGVMARRDKIVALFDRLIAQKGEKEVLY